MLPQIRVASPCTADWSKMAGDDRVRHCADCNLNVYNFSAMTEREVARLLAASKGTRLCGRLYRRADGTILTRDCPVGLRTRIRRVSRRVGAALSAAMSLGVAAAQTPQNKPPSLIQIQSADSAIDILVMDPAEAVIPNASVSIARADRDSKFEGTTGRLGTLSVANLPPGKYALTVTVPGFRSQTLNVSLSKHEDKQLKVVMQVAVMGEIVVVSDNSVKSRLSSLAHKLGF